MVVWLALTLTLSPRRGNSHCPSSVLRKIVRPILTHDISTTRRMILPLLGERAGVREVVASPPICRGQEPASHHNLCEPLRSRRLRVQFFLRHENPHCSPHFPGFFLQPVSVFRLCHRSAVSQRLSGLAVPRARPA